jgi:hypothetical protein
MAVVQPAYHSGPNLGHGAGFAPGLLLASRRFNWLRVFANSAGYVIAISMAPAVAPASSDRRTVGCILCAVSYVVLVSDGAVMDLFARV